MLTIPLMNSTVYLYILCISHTQHIQNWTTPPPPPAPNLSPLMFGSFSSWPYLLSYSQKKPRSYPRYLRSLTQANSSLHSPIRPLSIPILRTWAKAVGPAFLSSGPEYLLLIIQLLPNRFLCLQSYSLQSTLNMVTRFGHITMLPKILQWIPQKLQSDCLWND